MRIEFTGRQTEVPDELRALAERKLAEAGQAAARDHPTPTSSWPSDKHRQIAEVSVHSPHLDLAAAEESADLGVSWRRVIDKLTRQAQRQHGQAAGAQAARRRRAAGVWPGGATPTAAEADGAAGHPEPALPWRSR